MTRSELSAIPCPAMAIARAAPKGGNPTFTAAGSRIAAINGNTGVGQNDTDSRKVTTASTT